MAGPLTETLWALSQRGAPIGWASDQPLPLPGLLCAHLGRGLQQGSWSTVLSHSQLPQGSLRARSSPRGLPIPRLLGLEPSRAGSPSLGSCPRLSGGTWASAPKPEQVCRKHCVKLCVHFLFALN